MNTKIITLSATLLLATLALTHAGEPPKPAPASAEFERMKSGASYHDETGASMMH